MPFTCVGVREASSLGTDVALHSVEVPRSGVRVHQITLLSRRRIAKTGFALFFASSVASATPFMADPAIPPTPTKATPDLVRKHPGKEFTDEKDRTAKTLNNDSRETEQQTIAWDGKGGTKDSTRFPRIPAMGFRQIDALAFVNDTLFTEVATNETAILFSTRGGKDKDGEGVDLGAQVLGQIPPRNCLRGSPVCFETTGGLIGTWATQAQVDNMEKVTNLDALEVWGPPETDNANKFSLHFDFVNPQASIFNADSTVYLAQETLGAAVLPFFPGARNPDDFDIDALMVNDRDGDPGTFGQGDQILFSLWPDENNKVIGDEVFRWTFGDDIGFLNHGGHAWNSNWLGLNVDALEAAAKEVSPAPVPEPSAFALIAVALAGLGFARRRKVCA